jgi:hypothetical protein
MQLLRPLFLKWFTCWNLEILCMKSYHSVSVEFTVCLCNCLFYSLPRIYWLRLAAFLNAHVSDCCTLFFVNSMYSWLSVAALWAEASKVETYISEYVMDWIKSVGIDENKIHEVGWTATYVLLSIWWPVQTSVYQRCICGFPQPLKTNAEVSMQLN